jgi:hypothetical protein
MIDIRHLFFLRKFVKECWIGSGYSYDYCGTLNCMQTVLGKYHTRVRSSFVEESPAIVHSILRNTTVYRLNLCDSNAFGTVYSH